jgi:hypothetical protein
MVSINGEDIVLLIQSKGDGVYSLSRACREDDQNNDVEPLFHFFIDMLLALDV